MVDQMVLKARKWVNSTYARVSGYVPCREDGKTAWRAMYALTRALQHELGIATKSDSSCPATLSLLESRGPIGAAEKTQTSSR